MTRQEMMWQEQEVTEFNIQVMAPSDGLVPDQMLQSGYSFHFILLSGHLVICRLSFNLGELSAFV